ncbi:glycerate kinase [Antrihabitans spumae]|uniref:Glycerate kinase n=1 Tax=Antrihabitans spumae TaxID=3373370 RepID=A0ABW7KPE3_9NOCA
MRVVVAPDKFKGSLTAADVADALASGILDAKPEWTVQRVPIADGGDGTVAAAVAAGWEAVSVATEGPTGTPVVATYARRGSTAVVELAAAVGLVLLPNGRAEPLTASTFGLGLVMKDALERGAREIVIGLGGSASTDGGAGMMQALGARILNADGSEVERGGAALAGAARIDLSGLVPAAAAATFVLACDVDNPLLGENGATAVYAPQKGADAADLVELEAALAQWASTAAAAIGRDVSTEPGAGAAGGTGFGAMAFLGARQRPGIDIVLELVGFDAVLVDADLVVTGEGSLDEQSLAGKAPIGVAARAQAVGVPVVAVAGRSVLSNEQLRAAGFARVYTLSDVEPVLERSIANAAELLEGVGRRITEQF